MSLSNLTEKHLNKVGDNLTDVRIVYKDELYHYGVKGMKWGRRKSIYDVNANYYNNKAAKLTSKANRNRMMADMNRRAAGQGSGLISKANSFNANYYSKKANKLDAKANRNKTMASMNEAASKQRQANKMAKGRAKAEQTVSKMSKNKISKTDAKKNKRGKDYVEAAMNGYRNTDNVYLSLNQNPSRYQKAMRRLGGSNFARNAAVTSNRLTESQKDRALRENDILRAERKLNRTRQVVGAAKAVRRVNK